MTKTPNASILAHEALTDADYAAHCVAHKGEPLSEWAPIIDLAMSRYHYWTERAELDKLRTYAVR